MRDTTPPTALLSTVHVKTQCEREDAALAAVLTWCAVPLHHAPWLPAHPQLCNKRIPALLSVLHWLIFRHPALLTELLDMLDWKSTRTDDLLTEAIHIYPAPQILSKLQTCRSGG